MEIESPVKKLHISDYLTYSIKNCITPNNPSCKMEAMFYWPSSFGPHCVPCSMDYLTKAIEKLENEIVELQTHRHKYSPSPESLEEWIDKFTMFRNILKSPNQVNELRKMRMIGIEKRRIEGLSR